MYWIISGKITNICRRYFKNILFSFDYFTDNCVPSFMHAEEGRDLWVIHSHVTHTLNKEYILWKLTFVLASRNTVVKLPVPDPMLKNRLGVGEMLTFLTREICRFILTRRYLHAEIWPWKQIKMVLNVGHDGILMRRPRSCMWTKWLCVQPWQWVARLTLSQATLWWPWFFCCRVGFLRWRLKVLASCDGSSQSSRVWCKQEPTNNLLPWLSRWRSFLFVVRWRSCEL